MIESSAMKILLLTLLLALPTFAQITTRYDKFKDRTIVKSEERYVSAGLKLTATAIFKGETKGDDITCYLLFQTGGRTWKFLDNNELIFLADGERIPLRGRHDGEVSSRYASVSEAMLYAIRPDDLAKLAKASSLEMKIGSSVVKYGEKDKKPLIEMADYLK